MSSSSQPSKISPHAQSGFANASSYDKHRPSYLPAHVEQLLQSLHVASISSATIVDLAAGTGKFTELLAQRPENYEIIAVEPHDGMRGQLEAKTLKNVKVLKGAAERMQDVPSESVDAVICAQSFHWFANLDALEEIYRVLKPTGTLGMIWNIECYNSPQDVDTGSPWETKVRDITWKFDDGNPRFRHGRWKEVFDEQIKGNPFSILGSADPMFGLPIGEERVPQMTWSTKEEIWNRYTTLSQIAVLQGEELARVKKTFDDALNEDDVEINDEGKVAVHGNTHLAWASKIPGRPLRNWG